MDKLSLEIVAPDGYTLKERVVEKVVFRRREKRFELGSEVVIYPLHGPTLIRIPIAPIRYEAKGSTYHLAVAGGFVEVKRDRVLVLTPKFDLVSPRESNPRAAARQIAEAWRKAKHEFRDAMIGYPL